MSDAFSRQVAGDHYVKMGMQPSYFSMRNGWDSDSFSCLKYLSRHRAKDKLEGLKKPRHFLALRLANIDFVLRSRRLITMGHYIRANMMTEDDAWALLQLEAWVEDRATHHPLVQAIEYLMKEYTGPQTELGI